MQNRQIVPLVTKVIVIAFTFFNSMCVVAQAKKVQDTSKINVLDEIKVATTRLSDKAPFAHTTVKKETLTKLNLGQDLPILLDQMPSVITTSDAGTGIGYTSMRIRGSDATRVNVTINGIPYNDAESQGTFWVNMPDFVTSVQDIQLQRGAGTSTNGSGAFGASLNLRTLTPSINGYASTSHSIGSFGTVKNNITFGTGINKGFYAEGRLSKIASNGYIDRASSNLKSFYAETGFITNHTAIKALVFGGKEITYQSWYGTPQAVAEGDINGIQAFINRNYSTDEEAYNLLHAGRTYNYYTYDNQVDNYEQTHYQLHVSHQFSTTLNLSISGNFTKGKGFYEEFKPNQKLAKYFPEHSDGKQKSDVVRQKWLDNDFYALVYALNYKKNDFTASIGGGFNLYNGEHFGQLIKHKFSSLPITNVPYYSSIGRKEDFSIYAKGEYVFYKKFLLFADVQARTVGYNANGLSSDLKRLNVKERYSFFNPKAGFTVDVHDKHIFYGSIAVANKEPNRNDLTKNPIHPKPEQLIDYECGYRFKSSKAQIQLNGFYMHYNNQLVLTGALDDVGDPIRENVSKSFRVGLEIDATVQPNKYCKLAFNFTKSNNKIRSFDYVVPVTEYDAYGNEQFSTSITHFTNTTIAFSPSTVGAVTATLFPMKQLSVSYIQKYVGEQFLDNTGDWAKHLSAYHTGHVSVQYTFRPKNFAQISLNLLVNNIYNKLYVSNGYTYSYYYIPQGAKDPAVTENFYYPQAGRNILTGVTLSF